MPVRSSAPRAVCLSAGTMYFPFFTGRAPRQIGTVSTWAIRSRRGPGRVPGSLRTRLPICAAVRDFAMGLIEAQHFVGRPRLAELIDEERHDRPFLAAETGNGERLEQ